MFFKNFFQKFIDREKRKIDKDLERINSDKIKFENQFSKEIERINKKIKGQKKLNFLHSGHAADIINVLPVIKELSKNHECNLYINLNKKIKFYLKHPAGNFLINEKIFNMLLPLLRHQKYLNKVEKYSNQEIDVNFDLFRELPINNLFDNAKYASVITGIHPDLNLAFLEAENHKEITNKIIIQRTFRYRNNFVNFNFLNNYNDLYFVGTFEEYKDLKSEVKNLSFYECKDFLDMANVVKSSKFVLANSSITFPIAEGSNKPRLLESCPYFPAAQPHGKNAFNFYFQNNFEELFDYLDNLNLKD